jgi:hypothetical protein
MRKVLINVPSKGLYESVPDPKKPGKTMRQFAPCLWMEVRAREKTSTTGGVFAKIYIYDEAKHLVATLPVPSNCLGGLPPFLESDNATDLLVPIPKNLLGKRWNALVVIGDQYEAAAKTLTGNLSEYKYPERELVARQGREMVARHKVEDPVVTLAVKTLCPKQPVLTFLMRPPKGISDYSEVEGVLCAAVLANSPEEIKQMLLAQETEKFGDKFAFADEHKLAIIAWGSRRLWTGKNYSDQTKEEIQLADRDFNDVADAWENGIKQLGTTYGIPMHDFLLWGISGASHWAGRIALRKPDYFLAVHVHISQHFDAPRTEANRILWLLTAGEIDIGYQNTIRFFQDAKKLNYPIIHKGIDGMGHGRSPITDTLGTHFYEYALSLRAARDAFDQAQKDPLQAKSNLKGPWVESFRNPPFYGDVVNQESCPADQADKIPEAFRTALPTKEIATAWSYKLKPASESAAEMRPANAGENLALNKPFVCSNPHPTVPKSGGLTDGEWDNKTNQTFITGDSPQFPKTATIDLVTESNVSMVFLGVPVYSATKTIIVSVSADGKNFADVGSYVFAYGNEEQHLFTFPARPTRYVRLTYPDHYGQRFYVCTSEVEVYAPEK